MTNNSKCTQLSPGLKKKKKKENCVILKKKFKNFQVIEQREERLAFHLHCLVRFLWGAGDEELASLNSRRSHGADCC